MNQRANRRQFGKEVAAAAIGTCAASAATDLAAQPEQPKTPRTIALVALTELVRARHGQHLTAEQLQQVRQKIANGLVMAETLKRSPLANGDEPDFVFQA